MAGYELIDAHVASLARGMAWRPDDDDILAELTDHLYSAVEGLEADGMDAEAAQHKVLARFGHPGQVVTAFGTSGADGLAVPTRFTVGAGVLAMVAAASLVITWTAWISAELLDRRLGGWEGMPQVAFLIGTLALMGGLGCTAGLVIGLHRRHGGFGLVGYGAMALAALAAVSSILSWFVFGWGGLLAAAMLAIGLAVLRRGLAPRWAAIAVASAWPLAGVVYGTARYFRLGQPDQWGDYPDALVAGLTAGCLLFAAGSFGLGRWLMSEEPVQVPQLSGQSSL
jgi:hypothetical protein